jgi:hypothetical protein
VYIRNVVGYEHSHHAPTDRPFVRCEWSVDLSRPGVADALFSDLDPRTVGGDGALQGRLRSGGLPALRGALLDGLGLSHDLRRSSATRSRVGRTLLSDQHDPAGQEQ